MDGGNSLLLDSGREDPDDSIIQNPTNTYLTQTRYFGKNIVFLFYKGEPLLTLGPHYSLFICTLLWLMIQAIVVYCMTVTEHPQGVRSGFIGIALITIFSFLATALKNPGIVTAKDHGDLEISELTLCGQNISIFIFCQDIIYEKTKKFFRDLWNTNIMRFDSEA